MGEPTLRSTLTVQVCRPCYVQENRNKGDERTGNHPPPTGTRCDTCAKDVRHHVVWYHHQRANQHFVEKWVGSCPPQSLTILQTCVICYVERKDVKMAQNRETKKRVAERQATGKPQWGGR